MKNQNENNRNILVVDDQPDNILIIKTHLNIAGYKVAIASNGVAALQCVRRIKPKLILLDIKMPKMNGFEVCEKLKTDSDSKSIPIIFITAYDNTKNIVEAFKLGAADYITKPLKKEELLAKVKNQFKIIDVNNYLDLQVKQQTSQLSKALEKAVQDDRLKSEFITSISHKIKTPINKILKIGELLHNENLPQTRRNYYSKMLQNNGNKILQTIDSIPEIYKLETKTILVVEDEEANYWYIETLLEDGLKIECKIIHARNGQEAINICKNNSEIDFVLMDIKMPIMNGHNATKQIKKFNPYLPIIAQTAYTTISDKKEATLAGCDDFISKPINADIFYKTVNKYLKTQ